MPKIILDSIAGGYDLSKINANFQKIEDELNDKVLYRDNTDGEPNQLEDDVDANGKRIYNLPDPVSNMEPTTKGYVEANYGAGSLENANNAAASAAASAVSAASAATSADSAALLVAQAALPVGHTAVSKTSATGAALLPVGTTAERDGSPATGYTRFNTTLGKNETWNGVAWVSSGGASGGGSDDVFYENSTNVTADYTITTGKNAMSAGPITINNGVTVTVPNGSVWSVV